MEMPNPTCPRNDCRYIFESGMTTAVYYQPVYNKRGENVNPDGNVTTGSVVCSACNKRWEYKTQYGKTSYRESVNQIQSAEVPSPVVEQNQPSEEGVATIRTSRVFIG